MSTVNFRALVATHGGHRNKTPRERFGAAEASSDWVNHAFSVLELVDWILAGKAWCGCHFSEGSRGERGAGPSNLIVLDIDGDLSLDAFWAIPAVARHCLFTATTCSHSAAEPRFRAVFRCCEHDDPALHRALYHLWLKRLGLTLKDNAGEKPERLWFGNDHAEVTYGEEAEPISWELTEDAREQLRQAHAALPKAPVLDGDDLELDLQRAAAVLTTLLRPSTDGEYEAYWMRVLNAAAATRDDRVKQAFLQWHHRGHHSKTQSRVEKRLERAGQKMSAGEGAGRLLGFAKEQHGHQWWRQLPQDLWYGAGRSGTTPPPLSSRTVLGRASSASDISASGTNASGTSRAPDVVPSQAELVKLAQQSRHQTLATSSSRFDTGTVDPETGDSQELEIRLRRLYMLRAHGIVQTGDDMRKVAGKDRACLDRQLLGDLLSLPGYCNQPSEVERDLLALFRVEQGLDDNSDVDVKDTIITGENPKLVKWLIPNFLGVGHEHVLYSKPGVGKTTLALHMARAVTGDPALDRFLDSGPLNNHHLWRTHTVLFIGTDMFASAEEMTTQYLQDFGLLGLEFLQQVVWWFQTDDSPPWQLNLKDLTKLYHTLESHHHNGTPIPAVFIDSMKAVCPDHLLVGQQGFKDYIKLIKMICKRFSAALVWVHHSRADGSGAQGITRITEGSDANFHLKRDEKTRQITLEIEKTRGGRGRTLYINPFKTIPVVLPSPEMQAGDDDEEANGKEQLILEVLAEHFKQHRLLNMTSSAEYIERSYLGMKISEIEAGLRSRFRGQTAGFSRSSLERLIRSLATKGRIAAAGKARYRLPCHFQPDLSGQPDLLEEDESESADTPDLPGW